MSNNDVCDTVHEEIFSSQNCTSLDGFYRFPLLPDNIIYEDICTCNLLPSSVSKDDSQYCEFHYANIQFVSFPLSTKCQTSRISMVFVSVMTIHGIKNKQTIIPKPDVYFNHCLYHVIVWLFKAFVFMPTIIA